MFNYTVIIYIQPFVVLAYEPFIPDHIVPNVALHIMQRSVVEDMFAK